MKKIIFICSGGMSTSIIVNKINELANSENLKWEISAIGTSQYQKIDSADLLCIAPQIKYMYKKVSEFAEKLEIEKVYQIQINEYSPIHATKLFESLKKVLK